MTQLGSLGSISVTPSLSRRNFVGWSAVGASAVAAPGLLSGCSSTGEAGTGGDKPVRGGHLIMVMPPGDGSPIYPATGDPQQGQGAITIINTVFDNLVRLDFSKPGFQLESRLAESYEISEDARTYVIRLRTGVKFHDGTVMTAEDVKYTLDTMLTSPFGQSNLEGYLKPSGVIASSDDVIELHLDQPNAFLMPVLRDYRCAIAKAGAKPSMKPVGTGAFKVVSYGGESFELARNDDYWDTSSGPYLDGIKATYVADHGTALDALAAGQVDLLYDPLVGAEVKRAQSLGCNLQSLKGVSACLIAVNPYIPPFDDVRVRQAMFKTLDRAQFVDTVYSGFATAVGDVPIMPDNNFYPDDLGVPAQDVEGALALLKEAGFNGPVPVTMYTSNLESSMEPIATVFVEQAKKAGTFDIDLKKVSATAYNAQYYGTAQMFSDTAGIRHPWSLAAYCYTGDSSGFRLWDVPETHKLLAQAAATSKPARQEFFLKQVYANAAREGSFAIPVIADQVFACSKSVKGLTAGSFSNDAYWETLWKS